MCYVRGYCRALIGRAMGRGPALFVALSVCLKERKSKLEVSSDISTKTPSKEKPKLDITQRISHRFRKNMYFEVMCCRSLADVRRYPPRARALASVALRHNGKDKATYEPPDKSGMFLPWGWGQQPQYASGTIVIVGDKCPVDKWSEYKDDAGDTYFHNPAKNGGKSQWKKPDGYDEMKKKGQPAPPSSKPPAKKEKQCKYRTDRKGWI